MGFKQTCKRAIVWLLTQQAKAVLRKYRPRIVAITGSVGKTSTKDAIYSVLSGHTFVRKSEKSFNSELGIPLTILGFPNAWNNPLRWAQNLFDGLLLILSKREYPEWLVLEVGADRPGDISSVAKWLPIDVAVLTRLPDLPVHVEFFDSPEDVVREKASLLNGLKPEGMFVLCADDEKSMALRDRVPGRSLTYGFSLGSDVLGAGLAPIEGVDGTPVGVRADVSFEGEQEKKVLEVAGTLGAHAIMPLLAACAVGRVLGYSLSSCADALADHLPPPGRMRLLKGIKDTVLIDDTYNASPAATLAGLDALTLLPKKGKVIAVLGDMLELGKYSVEAHRNVGRRVAAVCDILVTVGFRARDMADGALAAGMADGSIFQFEDSTKAGKYLEGILSPGDVVFLKGSQSMRMERTVEEIMLEPERASELLVRQESEWKKKY